MLTQEKIAAAETAIRDLVHSFTQEVMARQLESIMARYTPDAVSFDAIPPLVHDTAMLRKNWEMCFGCSQGEIRSVLRDLKVQASEDLAFAYGILDFTHNVGAENQIQCCMRMTTCFRKIDGQWKIVHDHCSAPFDPHTSQACLNLEA